MSDALTGERIGYALRGLAAELAAARREVLRLRRENRELKAKLAALGENVQEPDGAVGRERGARPTRSTTR